MTETQDFSNRLRDRLVAVDRRDWELWLLALGTVAILGIGFFFVLVPAVFLGQESIHIQANISSQLALGLLVLVLLNIAYLAYRQVQLRSLRQQSVSEALRFEVAHAQLLMDPLTKVLTRTAMQEILGKVIERVQRKQATLVFLYVDVDNFKQVNTRFGHLTGDLILAEIGGLLKSCIRGSDYAIRMGGDEFLVALVDGTMTGAQVVKNRIAARAAEWNQSEHIPGFVLSLSVGAHEFDGTQTLDQVLSEADHRMYAEKNGRAAKAGEVTGAATGLIAASPSVEQRERSRV
jgi:diguanylate cyclase (GGDEF)-like protein